jgi:hypothetical protein
MRFGPTSTLDKVPETPCGCGGGCGLTFKRTYKQRYRKFAQGCPVYAEQAKEKDKNYAKAEKKRRATKKGLEGTQTRSRRGLPPPEPRRVIHWCQVCFGMAWQRPKDRPCQCGGLFALECITTQGGTRHEVGELPPERLARIKISGDDGIVCYTESNRVAREASEDDQPKRDQSKRGTGSARKHMTVEEALEAKRASARRYYLKNKAKLLARQSKPGSAAEERLALERAADAAWEP